MEKIKFPHLIVQIYCNKFIPHQCNAAIGIAEWAHHWPQMELEPQDLWKEVWDIEGVYSPVQSFQLQPQKESGLQNWSGDVQELSLSGPKDTSVQTVNITARFDVKEVFSQNQKGKKKEVSRKHACRRLQLFRHVWIDAQFSGENILKEWMAAWSTMDY